MVAEGKVILVTGATGNSGFSTLKCLSEDDAVLRCGMRLRAAVYKKSKKIERVKELKNVEKVMEVDANMCDEELQRAFNDVDYVYLIPSSSKDRVKHIKNYVDCAKKAGVKFLLLFSWLRAEEGTTRYGREFLEMEEYVEESGIDYSFIRCSTLMQTMFLFSPDLRKGVLPLPLRDGQFAPLHLCDVAQLATTIFLNPDRHYNKAYHLTGPEVVNGNQLARIASKALQKDIKYINITPSGCKKLLEDSGLETWVADGFLELFDEIANNKYAFETHDLLYSLTGKRSTSLYTFFEQHRERFTGPALASVVREEPSEGMPEKKVEEKRGKTIAVTGPTERKGVAPTTAPITRIRPEGGFDTDTIMCELERTKEMVQRWIFHQESLLNYFGDLLSREEDRLKQFISFRDEIADALWDMRCS